MPEASINDTFCLLMWKNWILCKRNKLQLVFEIVFPIIMGFALLAIRLPLAPVTYAERYYESLAVINNSRDVTKIANWTVIYSPNHPLIENLMEDVQKMMNLKAIEGYDNELLLQNYLLTNEVYRPLAGIIFDESISGNLSTLPMDLDFKLMFPGECRLFPKRVLNKEDYNWQTNFLYDKSVINEPRTVDTPHGGPPSYYKEKFLSIQSAVSLAYIRSKQKRNVTLPKVRIQRFLYPAITFDYFLNYANIVITLIVLFIFLPSIMGTIKIVSFERHKHLKQTMLIMGMPNWLNWTAWFAKNFIAMIITLLITIFFLKVPFLNSVSVLTYSGTTTLLVFLLVYGISVISFSFMMSVMFYDPNFAIMLAEMLTFVPYFFAQFQRDSFSLIYKLLLCQFHNTAMAYGFDIITKREINSEGLHWGNFMSPNFNDNLSMFHVTLMLVADSAVYMLVAIFVKEIHSIYVNLLKGSSVENLEYIQNTKYFEPYPTKKKPSIMIKELRKVYSEWIGIAGASLNMYIGEVSVLLGDSGSGKTTLLSMLIGKHRPSSGTAFIHGFDIVNDKREIRQRIGYCPSDNILFDDLTVEEHISFYGILKGIPIEKAQKDIKKYLKALDLDYSMYLMGKELSQILKRKLCVALAFCGASEVIILDEPTAGLGLKAKKSVWDLIQQEKKRRTIILATKFVDEADIIGDRIAILAKGEVKCYASSAYLKRTVGTGYELTCEKGFVTDSKSITEIIEAYVPNTKVDSLAGTELSYRLNVKFAANFSALFQELEERKTELGTFGYGISMTTLEEVYKKMTYQAGPDITFDLKREYVEIDFLTGCGLGFSQMKAVLLKKAFCTMYNTTILAVKFLFPITILTFALVFCMYTPNTDTIHPLKIHLESYDNNPIAVLAGSRAPPLGRYVRNYQRLFFYPPSRRTLLIKTSIDQYLRNIAKERMFEFNRRNLVGCLIENNTITAYFNNQPYHTAPLALNLVFNAVLKNFCANCSISVTNDPLPLKSHTYIYLMRKRNRVGLMLAVSMGFGVSFTAALFIPFYIKERVTRAKHLQYVNGLNAWNYWFMSFFWDLLLFSLVICFMLITIIAFQEKTWKQSVNLSLLFLIFNAFIYCILPLVYIVSLAVESPSRGFRVFIEMGSILGCILFMLSKTLAEFLNNTEAFRHMTKWVFPIIPHYALMDGIFNLHLMNLLIQHCERICHLITDCNTIQNLCKMTSHCCDLHFYALTTDGIGIHLIYLYSFGTFYFFLLFLFERAILPLAPDDIVLPRAFDVESDVIKEKQRVKNMKELELRTNHIVVKDISKNYNETLVVNQISFAVGRGECFGLLGVHEAGKSTLMKMLAGDEIITKGTAFVKGVDLSTHLQEGYRHIGYCPQDDALLGELSGHQNLKMFCLLRGIPSSQIEEVIMKLGSELNFYRQLERTTYEYKDSNRRKLSVAVALLGYPPVVLLDEPTTGIDPMSQRQIWKVIHGYMRTGKSVIMTSSSMEECEALCTRLAVIVKGELKFLGTTQLMKIKYSRGLVLIIKCGKTDGMPDIEPVKRFVKMNFPGSFLKETNQGRLTYEISSTQLKWFQIYSIMEYAKPTLKIESYFLSQKSLEHVFNYFVN